MRLTSGCIVLASLYISSYVSALSYPYPDCTNGPMANYSICNPNASIDVRALDFLKMMNVTEKIGRVFSGMNWTPSPAIPRLGIPPLQWINDAVHALRSGENVNYVDGDGPFNSSTAFPAPINFAATFNDRLVYGMGDAIGIEARAFTNAGRGGVDLWAPNINPFRDPRWGRGQEVPGEDPYVGRRYAFNFVTGMQTGEDPRYYKAVSACKHFAAYDLEIWNGTDRDHFDAQVSTKELIEYFLPPFEACIRDARAGSIMCSYNALNGVPACANSFLLQTIARDMWQFDIDGSNWVVGDCNAVADIYFTHHYHNASMADSAAAAFNAGCDLECGVLFRDHLPEAINRSLVTEERLNEAVLRLTKSLIRMGYFDPPEIQIYRQYGPDHVNSPKSWALAYQAAVQSQTLLKNDGTLLPLDAKKVPRIAVIGPLATDTFFIQGNYYGKASFVVSVLNGIQSYNSVNVTYVQGCDVSTNRTDGFAAALNAAAHSDLTIYVGGLTTGQEDEGLDRTSLEWPGVQAQLITKLQSASKAPIILLVMGGGQIDMTIQRDSERVGAIVWMGYGSMFGGQAVADVVYGKFSPSGRLPTTSYPASYVSLSEADMQLRPNKSTGNPGRTYLWYTGTPVFPFGFGMSYSTFDYDMFDMDSNILNIQDAIAQSYHWGQRNGRIDLSAAPFHTWAANVTNTGSVISDTSVLVFVNSTVPDTPIQMLVGYDHLTAMEPGETRTVYFDITMHSMAKVDENGDRWLIPGSYTLFIGHSGHAERTLNFELMGEAAIVQTWPRNQPDDNERHNVRTASE